MTATESDIHICALRKMHDAENYFYFSFNPILGTWQGGVPVSSLLKGLLTAFAMWVP